MCGFLTKTPQDIRKQCFKIEKSKKGKKSMRKEKKRQEKHGIVSLFRRFLLADFGSISTPHRMDAAVGNFVVGKKVEHVLLFPALSALF